MRSLLLIRPDCDKDIEAAVQSGADCLVFDLARTAAIIDMAPTRQRVLASLHQARQNACPASLYVRVSSLPTGRVDADLDAIMSGHPDGIILPKSQNGGDVQHLSVKLSVREAELGQSDGATKIIATVAETAAAIFEMGSYRGASRRLAGLIYGGAELGSALGIAVYERPDGTLNPLFALARSLTLFAAKAANVAAIDAALPSDSDETSLSLACEAAKRDGFSAKLAVHSHQVAVINAVLAEK